MPNTDYHMRNGDYPDYVFRNYPPIPRGSREVRIMNERVRGQGLRQVTKYLVHELPDGIRFDKWFTAEELDVYEQEMQRRYQEEVDGPYSSYLQARETRRQGGLHPDTEFVFTPFILHMDLTYVPPRDYLMPRGMFMCNMCSVNVAEPLAYCCEECNEFQLRFG